MKNNRFILLISLIVIFFSSLSANAFPDAFKICPENSEAIIYLDVRAFREYTVKSGIAEGFKNQITKIKELSTIDLLKDINFFTAILTNISNYRLSKNPEGAFIFEGYFRISDIEAKLNAAGLKSEQLENIKMIKLDANVYLALLSEKFIMYGNLSEIKAISALISAKEKASAEKNLFFNAEINAPDIADKKFMALVKLPKILSDLASAIAKLNKEQAVFAGLDGFVMAVSGSEFFFKYIYQTKDDAAKGAVAAKEFMENGFNQIASNAKKLTGSQLDATKVKIERVNFIKNGLALILKIRETMKIEQKEKGVFIKFDLGKAGKEAEEMSRSLADAFIASLVKQDAKAADSSKTSGN